MMRILSCTSSVYLTVRSLCLSLFARNIAVIHIFSIVLGTRHARHTHSRTQDLPVLPEKVPHAVSRRDSVRVWSSARHAKRRSLVEAAQGAPVRVRRAARHRVHASADVCDAQRLWAGRALPRVRTVRCLGDCHVILFAVAISRHSGVHCTA